MLECSFELNGQAMSTLICGAESFPAFSGLGRHVNRRESVCLAKEGAIPPGSYYIFDRQAGGLLGGVRDLFNDRHEWFALYAADGAIDDETFCNKVKRGNFRLHPKGPLGISQGCVTIDSTKDFKKLQLLLRGKPPVEVPGVSLRAYGMVVVK